MSFQSVNLPFLRWRRAPGGTMPPVGQSPAHACLIAPKGPGCRGPSTQTEIASWKEPQQPFHRPTSPFANSALNAAPYSFTAPQLLNGEPVGKAAYALNRFGLSAGGPLDIPKLFHSDKTFWFLNYNGTRSRSGFDRITNVPTLAQRGGDFTGGPTIYDPSNNQPFANNTIPINRLNSTALVCSASARAGSPKRSKAMPR